MASDGHEVGSGRLAPEYARLPEAAKALVAHLRMSKIPHEGPWFVETWRSTERVGGALAARYPGPRVVGTAIHALLTHECFSALHRLRSDETWHFYAGFPLELFLISPEEAPDGRGASVTLGPDLLAGERPQHTVPRGTWMAARPHSSDPDAYSLIGNTVTPGFEYDDYEPGPRDELVAAYPQHAAAILAFTREG